MLHCQAKTGGATRRPPFSVGGIYREWLVVPRILRQEYASAIALNFCCRLQIERGTYRAGRATPHGQESRSSFWCEGTHNIFLRGTYPTPGTVFLKLGLVT